MILTDAVVVMLTVILSGSAPHEFDIGLSFSFFSFFLFGGGGVERGML